MQGLPDAADLSDRTFKALDEKAVRLRKLKVATRSHLTILKARPAWGPVAGCLSQEKLLLGLL